MNSAGGVSGAARPVSTALSLEECRQQLLDVRTAHLAGAPFTFATQHLRMPSTLMAEPRGRPARLRRDVGGAWRGASPERADRRVEGAGFHQRLRDLTIAFSRGVSSSLSLEGALQTLASDANSLLAASRTSVWLHQRRARRLVLMASSIPSLRGRPATSRATIRTRRRARDAARPAGVLAEPDGPVLLVPLRGWRRASAHSWSMDR